MSASARNEILTRVRSALQDVPADEHPDDVAVPRDYQASHAVGDIIELFAERVADYRAWVVRIDAEHVPAQIGLALARRGVRRLVVPDGFPDEWLPDTATERLSDEPPLALTDLDSADGVITTAAVGIAVTGTVVLDAGPGQGRRALSLVPDYHLCVIRADQIAADVPAALATLDPTRPLTFISGPSATSDIELERVEGVHGPRVLDLIVVHQADQTPEFKETDG